MITIIDLSSDDETPIQKQINVSSTTTTQEQRNRKTGQHCQISPAKTKRTKNDNCILIDGNENDFIDHVVMIWLNRVKSGYKNIEMPDNILKAKAKEAARIIFKGDNFISPNNWLRRFKQKLKKMQTEKQIIDTRNSKVFRIEEIIREERPKFLIEKKQTSRLREIEDNQQKKLSKMLEEQKKHLEEVKETQRKQLEQMKEAQKRREDNLHRPEEMKTVPPTSSSNDRMKHLQEVREAQKKQMEQAKETQKLRDENLCRQEEMTTVQPTPLSNDRMKHLLEVREAQKKQMEQVKETQKRQDDNFRIQIDIKNAEQGNAENVSKTLQPTTVTNLQFGVLRNPEEIQISEVRGAVPHTPLPETNKLTLYDEVIDVDDVDDVLDEPIQSYEEALDCLALVENYFLSVRNLKAVIFVNQIEGFLKQQLDS